MPTNNVSNNVNNSAAQLQLYANEKARTEKPATSQPQNQNPVNPPLTQTDSVQISAQARTLLAKDLAPIGNVTPLTNGMGIEPPKGS